MDLIEPNQTQQLKFNLFH